MDTTNARLPVWLIGLCNLPYGIYGGVMFITMPQLMAANHLPVPDIASVVSFGLIASFTSFLISPLIDWRFTRRFYAIVMALLAAFFVFSALLCTRNPHLLAVLLFGGLMSTTLYVGAIGGWFSGLVSANDTGKLGAWFAVANVCGGGFTAMIAMPLLRDLPYVAGALILCGLLLSPLPLFLWLKAPPADSRLASESFAAFFRDVLQLLKKPAIWWMLLLFTMPAASFALTNILGGVGADYGASEKWVGLVCGAGGMIAGAVGSLVVPRLFSKLPYLPLYLLIGSVGAVFTLSLIVLPHTPVVFAVAMLFESLFQAAAFAVENALILREVGEDNPLASTQYALLYAAPCFPIAYMGALDGAAYGLHGLNGSFLTDAGLSLGACIVLALLFRFVRRKAV